MNTEDYPRSGPCDAYLKWTLKWAEEQPKRCGKFGRRWFFTLADCSDGKERLIPAHGDSALKIPFLLCRRHRNLAMSGYSIFGKYEDNIIATAGSL